MTVYVVFKTARQIDGELVFVSAERAFKDTKKAEDYWRSLGPNVWQENIMVDSGYPGYPAESIPCRCERAIHPVEVEE